MYQSLYPINCYQYQTLDLFTYCITHHTHLDSSLTAHILVYNTRSDPSLLLRMHMIIAITLLLVLPLTLPMMSPTSWVGVYHCCSSCISSNRLTYQLSATSITIGSIKLWTLDFVLLHTILILSQLIVISASSYYSTGHRASLRLLPTNQILRLETAMMATAMLMQQSPASQGHLTAIPDQAFLAATGTSPILLLPA